MTLGIAILLTFVAAMATFQIISRLKNVPPSRLAVVHGKAGADGSGFKTFKGGRVFVLPLIQKFSSMDLTPKTTTVVVESAIANGIVPLVVKATVSFGVSGTKLGLGNAVRRILNMTRYWDDLIKVANSIIEGHLRDSLAQMTPEEVMSHKEQLVKNMIQVCKSDLEGLGLEITTMNIADVEDHRFQGVEEPDLYIELLKRIQTANAEMQSRTAKAEALAASSEQGEARRAEVEIRKADNERQGLETSTKLQISEEEQRSAVGVEQAQRRAEAEVAGILKQVEAEKERIRMLEAKFRAEVVTPAKAQRDKQVLEAQAEATLLRKRTEAELIQVERTIDVMRSAGKDGLRAYMIEKFGEMIDSFASTMDLFPASQVTVVSGGGLQGPISAVHPGALDMERNRQIAAALAGVTQDTPIEEPTPTGMGKDQMAADDDQTDSPEKASGNEPEKVSEE